MSNNPLSEALEVIEKLKLRLNHAVRGRSQEIELLLTALLADGHVLLEDFPGSGKTTLAKALGESIITKPQQQNHIEAFRRVQFTPDLLPSDITGVYIFEAKNHEFIFRPGPLFAHVVLADEINRTSPKVQAAMLEAMAEKQVTIDNNTHTLDPLFFVIATQNPRDSAGTYPLPVAQQDRFLFKIAMKHISADQELEVLKSYRERRQNLPDDQAPPVHRDEVLRSRSAIDRHVKIPDATMDCLVEIANSLRNSPQVLQGVSTRSLVLALPALQVAALLKRRDYVLPEDLKWLLPHLFRHRVVLAPGATDIEQVLLEHAQEPLEKLTRSLR